MSETSLRYVLLGAGGWLLLSGSDGPSGVAGVSAALLDPQNGDVRSEFAVGATPIDVVSDELSEGEARPWRNE